MKYKKVLITHVPYQHRGGEDVHVESLAEAYSRIGIQAVFFPTDRSPPKKLGKNALKSLSFSSALSELNQVVSRERPDFVHAHNVYPLLVPAFFRWVIDRDFPAVMTVHNHRFFCTNGLALRDSKVCKDCFDKKTPWPAVAHNCNASIAKSVYYSAAISQVRHGDLLGRAIRRFVAPSPYIQGELERFGIPASKVSCILNPVELTDEPTIAMPIEQDVLYAGRLSQEKGIEPLLAACRLMPEVRFAIAGDGPLRARVEVAVQELKNLRYLGSLQRADILGAIAHSRIGVLPSICNEILPTFVLECFMRGKVCVVPDLESTRWLAADIWPGELAETDHPTELARAVRAALHREKPDAGHVKGVREKLRPERFQRELRALIEGL